MKKILATLAGSAAFFASHAFAADIGPVMSPDKWFVHIGAAGVIYDPGFNTPPAAIARLNPGLQLSNNITAVIEAGRYLNDNISLSLGFGYPPTTNITLTNVPPKLAQPGSVTFGSVIMGAQYHFNTEGQIKPYVGAGLAYNIVFGTTPNAPNPLLKVDNGIGAVLQAGVEADMSQNMGVFFDAKKMFASSNVTTGLGSSNAYFNPWILSAGLNFRF